VPLLFLTGTGWTEVVETEGVEGPFAVRREASDALFAVIGRIQPKKGGRRETRTYYKNENAPSIPPKRMVSVPNSARMISAGGIPLRAKEASGVGSGNGTRKKGSLPLLREPEKDDDEIDAGSKGAAEDEGACTEWDESVCGLQDDEEKAERTYSSL
jgi:hypothetical protein